MANHKDWELADLHTSETARLRKDNERLLVEIKRLASLCDSFGVDAINDEAKIEELRREIGYLMEQNSEIKREHNEAGVTLEAMRAQGALIVHALDCAIRWAEALFAFWPAGTPMHPDVGACKHQLDEAMSKIGARGPVGSSGEKS
jgi:hypothetical protein